MFPQIFHNVTGTGRAAAVQQKPWLNAAFVKLLYFLFQDPAVIGIHWHLVSLLTRQSGN